jgi:hypothetical protein
MARTLPKPGTNLRPYDSMRRYRATVLGYTMRSGVKKVRLKSHGTGRETIASLDHLAATFHRW